MISKFAYYFNPVCDCCGKMLPAEYCQEDAEKAMKKAGWRMATRFNEAGEKVFIDVCKLCQHKSEFAYETFI